MQKQTQTVVVGYDFEADGELAFHAAMRLGTAYRNTTVHLVHATKAATSEESDAILDRLDAFINRWRENHARELQGQPVKVVAHVGIGKPASVVLEYSVHLAADLIVVGTHNPGIIKRLVLGSVSSAIVAKARCPVMVARPKDHSDVSDLPEVEPQCDACITARLSSNGERLWCETHEQARFRPRIHTMAGGSGASVRPGFSATPEV